MLINSKSKEYISNLLDNPMAADAIDAGNWDKVFKYYFHTLTGADLSITDRAEIYSDLVRFLLESEVNPLEGRARIPGFTFYKDYDLSEIPDIPSSIKVISSNAYCEVSTGEPMTLRIPGTVEVIDFYAVSGCNDITEIIIEDGVKEIKSHAFIECNNLKYIELPKSLQSIGYIVDLSNRKYKDITVKFMGSADEFLKIVDYPNCTYFNKFNFIDENNEPITF